MLSPGQQFKGLLYKITDIPAIAVNESQNLDAYTFLRDLANSKHYSSALFSIKEIESVLTEILKDPGGACGLTEPDVPYIIERLKEKKKK
jgi:hypothetical protein